MLAPEASAIAARHAGRVPGCRSARRVGRVVLLAALLVTATPAASTREDIEERVKPLFGYWIAPSRTAAQARVLRITNVIFAEPASALLAGFYGPPTAILPDAKGITARLEGDGIALEIVAADGARVDLALTAAGRLQGGATRAGGPASALRFSRASLPEFHRFIAENPQPGARAGRRSVIELVYVGADDCSLCRRWEAEYLARGKLKGSREWQHSRFTEVKLATLTARFRVEDVPERLRPRFLEMIDGGMRIQGVPSFVLLVNGALRAHALGPAEFDTFVHVALRAAVREKLAL